MASTFTANVNLEEPARGDDVGTWDTPVNGNTTNMDLLFGGIATISGAAGSVVLSANQLRSRMLVINSTLTASITLTFATSFIKDYHVFHQATGSSAFTITLTTTAAGGQAICCPPGVNTLVYNDGTNLKYMNLERTGSYWDYAGSSVPNWVSGCTVPPYLNCDGSTFNPSTYPQLFTIMGSSILPDSRNRARVPLAQGAARLSVAVSGLNGGTLFAAGGNEAMQQHNHNLTLTDPGHTHTTNGLIARLDATTNAGGNTVLSLGTLTINSAVTGITVVSSAAGTGTTQNVQPTYIGGLTLIRAA
jgi:hypothetical protein